MKQIISLFLLCALYSCANVSLQPDAYSRDSAQQISNVLYGEIVGIKNVSIEGDIKSGTILGALVGGAAGSGISNSEPESEIGAILVGAIGATIGGNISKNIKTTEGLQITINTDDDKTISVVQEVSNYSFDVGDLVEIITTKGKTRVSPANLK